MYRVLAKRNQLRLPRLKRGLLANTAGRAIAALLPPLYDLDYQTIILRAGLRLGFIRSS